MEESLIPPPVMVEIGKFTYFGPILYTLYSVLWERVGKRWIPPLPPIFTTF